jgi:hypothetical protein
VFRLVQASFTLCLAALHKVNVCLKIQFLRTSGLDRIQHDHQMEITKDENEEEKAVKEEAL